MANLDLVGVRLKVTNVRYFEMARKNGNSMISGLVRVYSENCISRELGVKTLLCPCWLGWLCRMGWFQQTGWSYPTFKYYSTSKSKLVVGFTMDKNNKNLYLFLLLSLCFFFLENAERNHSFIILFSVICLLSLD